MTKKKHPADISQATYTPEYRAEAVKLALVSVTISEAARNLGISVFNLQSRGPHHESCMGHYVTGFQNGIFASVSPALLCKTITGAVSPVCEPLPAGLLRTLGAAITRSL